MLHLVMRVLVLLVLCSPPSCRVLTVESFAGTGGELVGTMDGV